MILSSIYSNGMILQRNANNVIKGIGKPGEKISCTLCNDLYETVCDDNGIFKIETKSYPVGGPYECLISGSESGDIRLTDIYFGDVFLLGGQSNMELPVSRVQDKEYDGPVKFDNKYIRMFQVTKDYKLDGPADILESGRWIGLTPDSINDFSAIGYFFACKKSDADNIPIGLVHTAVGGAPIESLMSVGNVLGSAKKIRNTYSLNGSCDLDKSKACIYCYEEMIESDKDSAKRSSTEKSDFERIANWHRILDEKDADALNSYIKSWEDNGSYEEFEVPGSFYKTKYENHYGSMWLQKVIEVPASLTGKDALLRMGTLIDADQIFFNGTKIGQTEYKYPPRRYKVLKDIIKEGKNVITVRLITDSNIGAAVPEMPYSLDFDNASIDISGKWKLREGSSMDKLEGMNFFIWHPAALFNSGIKPLEGYKFDAVLFYQGESNGEHPEYYDILLENLVNEWRNLFGENLPFYIAQLPIFGGEGAVAVEDTFKEIRDAQLRAGSRMNNVSMVDIVNLGQKYEIHTQNKKNMADRFWNEYVRNHQ